MDALDRNLLKILQENCKLSYAELGRELNGMSVSAVGERIKKLTEAGVIKSFAALVEPRALGLDICAFILLLTNRPENEADFIGRLTAFPEILECHHVTGEFSYLLKIKAKNTLHLESLIKGLKALPETARTNTLVVLSSPKETTALPVED
ncbi:MAG: Lrp/AsnC family transcriptional regulator [Thermodesulfobacteriota bacterium]